MDNKKTWYVTGASKGLGLALVKRLLSAGHNVAATSRTLESLTAAVGERSSSFLPLQVDLTEASSVANALEQANQVFGTIDVIVNNAGYGIGGALEELEDKEIADALNVNLFATINVIQQALPYLRAQRSGHIFNISSIAGFAPGMGWTAYAAAKFAVTGLSDALAQELQPLGIQVTAVAPGAFRTQFLTQESIAFAKRKIDDYQAIRDAHAKMMQMDGAQLGDPDKAADALMTIANNPQAPAQLFLGSDAYKRAYTKIQQLASQLEQWKTISLSTDFQ